MNPGEMRPSACLLLLAGLQLSILVPTEANDFSSFLSANASLGEFGFYGLTIKLNDLLAVQPLWWITSI